ncbi:hypothetical protein ACFXOI_29450 [Streptomyces bacillaris]|uniref:hypothetical protein n=1 Tax=Streptomyces TaxID=1883 RepID=UPI00200C51AE|nr:hypothetical protein [Streptomyces sp. HNA39]UQA34806.1 hypothetical protein KRR37_14445 [Streptomyces sp. HNA39]
MALTRYKFTATGTKPNGEPAEGGGQVDAENVREAEAMIIGLLAGQGWTSTGIDIELYLTPGCTQ